MKRKPAVAGQFYEASRSGLMEQVASYIPSDVEKQPALGIVSPHAGLIYSGQVAGAVYSRIVFPQTCVMLGPNHTGFGKIVSLMSSGWWQIPTGDLQIDEKFAQALKDLSPVIEEDSVAHQMEHSLEVQLPFILHCAPGTKIVPIVIMSDSLDVCRSLGEAIAEAMRITHYPVTIIASSDFSHYVTNDEAKSKDRNAIEKIFAIDPEGLYDTVRKERISMCGMIPVTTMLYAAKKLGATHAQLVKYMTSGDVSGEYDHVVGYAGIIINGSSSKELQ